MALTSKERKQLRSLAQTLDPLLIVGKENVGDGVVAQTKELLDIHEIVKGSVLETSELTAREVADILSEKCAAECVQVIGRKFVLYRPTLRPDVPHIVFTPDGAKRVEPIKEPPKKPMKKKRTVARPGAAGKGRPAGKPGQPGRPGQPGKPGAFGKPGPSDRPGRPDRSARPAANANADRRPKAERWDDADSWDDSPRSSRGAHTYRAVTRRDDSERADRSERSDRGNRGGRDFRDNRGQRDSRDSRGERGGWDRDDRGSRGERADRGDRGDRPASSRKPGEGQSRGGRNAWMNEDSSSRGRGPRW